MCVNSLTFVQMDGRSMWRRAGNSDDGMPIAAENGPGYGLNLAPGGALNVGGGLPLCVPSVIESQLMGAPTVPPTTGLNQPYWCSAAIMTVIGHVFDVLVHLGIGFIVPKVEYSIWKFPYEEISHVRKLPPFLSSYELIEETSPILRKLPSWHYKYGGAQPSPIPTQHTNTSCLLVSAHLPSW